MGRLDGKVALITGAARGQGRAHAVRIAREGADVVAVDICDQIESVKMPMGTFDDLQETARLVEALGRRCMLAKADARDPQQMRDVADRAVSEFGGLDIVVINHGILHVAGWDTVTDVEMRDALDTNVIGVWNSARATIPHLIERGGGSIVITSSAMGVAPMYGLLAYSTSKHGVIGLMRCLSAELAPHWIRVNAVLPSTVDTPMVDNDIMYAAFGGGNKPGAGREALQSASEAFNLLPVDLLEAEDIANAALFLASDEARYITGVALPVDGGMLNQPAGIPPVASQRIAELEGTSS